MLRTEVAIGSKTITSWEETQRFLPGLRGFEAPQILDLSLLAFSRVKQ